ncbi:MAG: hypothetical protein ABII09_10135 [Planctomycetota bacterium]
MVAKKELVAIISLTLSGFIIGVTPWALLLFGRTKNSVHWLGEVGFQYWGWFLVFCLTGYAFIKTLRLKTIPKTTRTIVVVVSLIILGWSLLWALLIILGLAVSTIV